MSEQNKNNKASQLILVKNRRILTRTQQSRQKLKSQFCYNNFLNDSNTSDKLKTSRNKHKTANGESIKIDQDKNEQQLIFYQLVRKEKIKSEFNTIFEQTIVHEKERNDMVKTSNRKMKTKSRTNFSPKLLDPYKPKMFSHKNLQNETQRIKSYSKDQLLANIQKELKTQNIKTKLRQRCSENARIDSRKDLGTEQSQTKIYSGKQLDNQSTKEYIADDTPAKRVQRILSMKVAEQKNQDAILQKLLTGRKGKLRINSKEYSVNLRINTPKTAFKTISQINQVLERVQTSKNHADFQKDLQYVQPKRPHKNFNQIHPQYDLNQDIQKLQSSALSSHTSSIQQKYHFQQRFFRKLKAQNTQNGTSVNPPETNHQEPPPQKNLTKQQQTLNYPETNVNKNERSETELFKKKNHRFGYDNDDNKPAIRNSISIDDIKINQLRSTPFPGLEPMFKKGESFQAEKHMKLKAQNTLDKMFKKTNSREIPKKSQTKESANESQSKLQSKETRKGLFTEISDEIQQVNIYSPQEEIVKGSQKEYQTERTAKKSKASEPIANQDSCKGSKKQHSEYNQPNAKENQRQTLENVIKKTDMIRCTGSVAKQCSQTFPKKNDTWRVPTLLLYLYRRNVSEMARQVYEQALKNQLCPESEYSEFVEENQLIKACLTRVHERAKKKGLVTGQIEGFIQNGAKFIQKNQQFFRVLHRQVATFADIFIKKKQGKNGEQYLKELVCCIKVMDAFLRALKVQFQGNSDESKGEMIIPQIDYQQLSEIRANILLEQLQELMNESAQAVFGQG